MPLNSLKPRGSDGSTNSLNGPIPIDWLMRAATLPGKSLHVALALCYEVSLHNNLTVVISNRLSRRFAVNRNAKYRALARLEEAGLIGVRRKLGQSPIVTIIEVESNQSHA